MNFQIATMDKEQALEQFERYKAAVRRSRDAADRLIMKSYKAMSEGLGVLNLKQALTAGGIHRET